MYTDQSEEEKSLLIRFRDLHIESAPQEGFKGWKVTFNVPGDSPVSRLQ